MTARVLVEASNLGLKFSDDVRIFRRAAQRLEVAYTLCRHRDRSWDDFASLHPGLADEARRIQRGRKRVLTDLQVAGFGDDPLHARRTLARLVSNITAQEATEDSVRQAAALAG